MSNNKQSSVEWLIEQLPIDYRMSLPYELVEQAKAMHKEEIINAWQKGDGEFDKVAEEMSLEYYNETYGGTP